MCSLIRIALLFASLCSDIWAMGCVLYELTTLKHAVSVFACTYCMFVHT